MFRVDVARCLELKNNRVIDNEIGFVLADDVTFKIDIDWDLLANRETCLAERNGQGIFVDFFEKAAAQLIVDTIKTANDRLRQFYVLEVYGCHVSVSAERDDFLSKGALKRWQKENQRQLR